METTGIIGVIQGFYRDYGVYIWVFIGIMGKKMEATIVYWGFEGNSGIMSQQLFPVTCNGTMLGMFSISGGGGNAFCWA